MLVPCLGHSIACPTPFSNEQCLFTIVVASNSPPSQARSGSLAMLGPYYFAGFYWNGAAWFWYRMDRSLAGSARPRRMPAWSASHMETLLAPSLLHPGSLAWLRIDDASGRCEIARPGSLMYMFRLRASSSSMLAPCFQLIDVYN